MSPAQFLDQHWQQRPLLIRGAWPDFEDPLSADELAGLACEDEVESRLVLNHGGDDWQLRHGPFAAAALSALPERDWTLLVQDVEKHVPELAAVLDRFRFLPDWRIDDLMISYAVQGGTVGPHWDEYDVFLLQGKGRRRWQINTAPVAPDNALADLELRIMREFQVEQEWVLEPGDVLYLPPKVAHYGSAISPSLTYSVGFRAPSEQELVGAFAEHLLDEIDPQARYRDPNLAAAAKADRIGQIDDAALAKVTAILLQRLTGWESDDETIANWFGRFVTEPKAGFEPPPPVTAMSVSELRQALVAGRVLSRHPATRFAFRRTGDDRVTLFSAGQQWQLTADSAWLAPLLCRQSRLDSVMLSAAIGGAASEALLLELINEGYLCYDDD